MQRHSRTRRTVPALTLVLALLLAACGGQQVEEDPRGALRDAIMQLRDYDGIEAEVGAQLDEDAQRSAIDDGGFSEDELALLTDTTLTFRFAQGDGDDDGQSEFGVAVSDESLLTIRGISEEQAYALVDLPAIERVAETMGAAEPFGQAISELEQMASQAGLEDVVDAAREGEWIRVAGLEGLAEMVGQPVPDDEQPDEAELDELYEQIGQHFLDFLDDPEVEVGHLGAEDAGERVRVTATGTQLRELAVALLDALEEVTGAATDAAGMGTQDLQRLLEEAISDDLRLALDAWIDGGEISQVALDVFELARLTDQPDVPDGEFLIAIGLADFTDDIEAPDTEVTLDMMEIFGAMMEGFEDMGDLDDMPADPGAPPDADLDDLCLTMEEAEELLESFGEDPGELDEDELEAMLGGVPIC